MASRQDGVEILEYSGMAYKGIRVLRHERLEYCSTRILGPVLEH